MTTYSFSDIDLTIQLLLRFAKAKLPIPEGLYNVVNNMCAEDQRLTIYFYHRLLRYPSLKRYCLQQPHMGEDASDDPQPDTQALLAIQPPQVTQFEMMYR